MWSERDHIMDKVGKVGNRQSTIDCMAKVVRALIVCKQVSIRTLADKADISVDTARRAMTGLLKEGLIKKTTLLGEKREYIYEWVGAA